MTRAIKRTSNFAQSLCVCVFIVVLLFSRLKRATIATVHAGGGTTDGEGDIKEETQFFYTDYRESELQKCEDTRKVPSDMLNTTEGNSDLISHLSVCSEDCPTALNGPGLEFERSTSTGKRTVDVVQRVLQHAWKDWDKRARPIDLFVRSGCRDAGEISFLFETVELFWPIELGHVIVVLDVADAPTANETMLPSHTKHKYRVFYERHPCMPGRVFNQMSYLMADYYSSADTIVTMDSDCIFHAPVTPKLLFSDAGRILLPWSAKFQEGFWDEEVEYFTGPGTYLGHSMVSQPVTVHRSTLSAYRDWFAQRSEGRCFLDGVAAFVDMNKDSIHLHQYCWMCQINTFIQLTKITGDMYELVDLESSTSRAYQRFAMHVTYETLSGEMIQAETKAEFKKSADEAVRQGLCRTLGSRVLQSCLGADVSYVKKNLFSYVGWFWKTDELKKLEVEIKHLQDLQECLVATGN